MLLGFLLFLIFIALIVAVETESNIGATVTMIITLGLAYYFYDFNVLTWLYHNFPLFAAGAAAYVLMGVIWARGKWEFFIRAIKRYYLERIEEGMKPTDSIKWNRDYQSIPPKISENKFRFIMWMSYWPVSMLWTLINDPIRRLFVWIYNSLAGSLQRASNNVFADIDTTPKKK